MSTQLALEGGTPLRTQPYPAWPQWDTREQAALEATLHSGHWWAPAGNQVKQLEQEFASYHEARYGVAVASGSAALEACLRAARVDWGDEVITSPYTFIATVNACLIVGAIPRFVDVLPTSWNMDPSQVEALITPRTKAIIAVHIGGEPADMDALGEIAHKHGLVLIEDACQAHGASWRGRKVGAIGDMGCFSFQASKNINGGEGGMILTNDEAWAERCWSASNVGRQRRGEWYRDLALADNQRLVEWPAAVLRVQLTRLEEQAAQRSRNAIYLADILREVQGIDPLPGDARVTRNAYHLFKLRYRPECFGSHTSQAFAAAMRAEGIPVSAGYSEPLSQAQGVLERTRFMCGRLDLPLPPTPAVPVTQAACTRGLWLLQNVLLATQADLDDVVRAALKVQSAWQS